MTPFLVPFSFHLWGNIFSMDHFRQDNPNQFLNLNTILLVCLPFLEALQKQKCKAEKEKKLFARLHFLAKKNLYVTEYFCRIKRWLYTLYIVSLYLWHDRKKHYQIWWKNLDRKLPQKCVLNDHYMLSEAISCSKQSEQRNRAV